MEYSDIPPGSRPLCPFETARLRDSEFSLQLLETPSLINSVCPWADLPDNTLALGELPFLCGHVTCNSTASCF